MPSWSCTTQCSATLPFTKRLMWTASQLACLPLGGIPANSPFIVCRARDVKGDEVSFADRMIDRDGEVGERVADNTDEGLYAFRSRWHTGREGPVVDDIGREHLVDDVRSALAESLERHTGCQCLVCIRHASSPLVRQILREPTPFSEARSPSDGSFGER